ncbi:hypothetical protein K502DRAFT_361775 [Neoconidiobolus thromboides FSU 785]|nr:hypothetical protein K502DRAFT_361775 [Neoconidiobolus thromboides FSU 785]
MYSINSTIPNDNRNGYQLMNSTNQQHMMIPNNMNQYAHMNQGYERISTSSNNGTEQGSSYKNDVNFYHQSSGDYNNEAYGYNKMNQNEYMIDSFDKSNLYNSKQFNFHQMYPPNPSNTTNNDLSLNSMYQNDNRNLSSSISNTIHPSKHIHEELEPIKKEVKMEMVPFSLASMDYQKHLPQSELSLMDRFYHTNENIIATTNSIPNNPIEPSTQSNTEFSNYARLDSMDFNLMTRPISSHQYPPIMYSDSNPTIQDSMILASDNNHNAIIDDELNQTHRRQRYQLDQVLPMVINGPRPYSPSNSNSANSTSNLPPKGSFLTFTQHAPKLLQFGNNMSMEMDLNNTDNRNSMSRINNRLGPLVSSQSIRIPSHLLLTQDQRECLEKIQVIKRVFDADDMELSHQFLVQFELTLEQLGQPLNKWKTRNTRRRKNAVTHLYQCCCGSDVKQFHGTKGTRRSKQKYPFVACLAFAEVARRTCDGALLWVRGLLNHSPECTRVKPFSAQ